MRVRSSCFTIVEDRRSRKEMLEKLNLLLVNQLAAQLKLVEAWKSIHVEDYPLKLRKERQEENTHTRQLRNSSRRDMEEGGRLKSTLASFTRDTGHLWNLAPKTTKEAKAVTMAKKEIKKFCKSLPIK